MSEKNKGYYQNKIKYIDRYNKENYQQFNIKLHKEYDADMISYLNSLDNKQGFIKDCIKAMIDKR